MALNKRIFYNRNNCLVGIVTAIKYKKRNSLIIYYARERWIVLFREFLNLKATSKMRNLEIIKNLNW